MTNDRRFVAMKMKRWENDAFRVLKVDARFSQEEFVEPVGEDEHIIEIYVHFTVDVNDDDQKRLLDACAEEWQLHIGYKEGENLEQEKRYIAAFKEVILTAPEENLDLETIEARCKVESAPVTRIYTDMNQYVFRSRRGGYYTFREFIVDSPSTRGLIADLNVLVKNPETPRGITTTYRHFFSIVESLNTFWH